MCCLSWDLLQFLSEHYITHNISVFTVVCKSSSRLGADTWLLLAGNCANFYTFHPWPGKYLHNCKLQASTPQLSTSLNYN